MTTNQKEDGTLLLQKWFEIFEKSTHRVFKGTSALNRVNMRKKKDNDTIHYNGESSNVELLYRIIHSVNQLCVYGAVTNWW